MSHRGTLYTVSAPSGAGKTSLVNALIKRCPAVEVSISHTTRPQRPGEKNGDNYHFVDEATFVALLNEGAFLEHAQVFSHYYGTSQRWVDETLGRGIDVILEIDWQGAAQIHRQRPECIGIFILPPSQLTLRQRLITRGQDDEKVIAARIAEARKEMSHYVEAEYVIINDQFDTALAEFAAIIVSQRLRLESQQSAHTELLTQLLS